MHIFMHVQKLQAEKSSTSAVHLLINQSVKIQISWMLARELEQAAIEQANASCKHALAVCLPTPLISPFFGPG